MASTTAGSGRSSRAASAIRSEEVGASDKNRLKRVTYLNNACLLLVDKDHTPSNKLHGSVRSTLEAQFVTSEKGGWLEISLSEHTDHRDSGRTTRRTITATLSEAERRQLAGFILEGLEG